MILQRYRALLRALGPQGWWPTSPKNSAIPVYTPKKSLKNLTEREMCEICLGSILTQNTSWQNVVRSLKTLNEKRALNLESLLAMPTPRLARLIRSSGYYRAKTKKLKIFLRAVKRETRGSFQRFFRGTTRAVREKLLEIWGIGKETADSMLLYAGGHPIFVVDAYTRRIAARWGVINTDDDYDEIQRRFMDPLPRDAALFGEYHAILVELGKSVCQKKPKCTICPVLQYCQLGTKNFSLIKKESSPSSSGRTRI